MILLGVSDVGVSFAGRNVLSGVTFSVPEGARMGIIGVNGVGKTTLLRVICGDLAPDTGTVSIAKGKTVGMLSQMTDLTAMGEMTLLSYMEGAFPQLLAMEAELERLSAAMTDASARGDHDRAAMLSASYDLLSARFVQEGGKTFRGRCRSMLLRLGFPEEMHTRRISEVSGGQHTRLSLARLLASEPDLLMLDEPTNHLDIDSLAWLEEYLASYPKTIVIVSHDRYFLDRVTDHTLRLSHTRAYLYKGNYSAAKEKQEADEASLERRRREQAKIRARIEANIEFQRRCGQEHNFVTIRSKQKQLDRMEVIEKAVGEKSVRMRFSQSGESAANVLTVRGLRFGYDKAKPLFSDVSFAVRRGERVLLLGPNGCGKSTLMKLLSGHLAPDGGYIDFGYRVEIGYYDQEIRGLDPTRTVMEEIHSSFPDRTELEIRSALALFLFDADGIAQKIGSLSGGERARVLLCKLMLKKVNLLLLDEPTNHLDISSREALEAALSDYEGTVIAVSHDRYFIDRIASRIIELCPAAEDGVIDYPLDRDEGAYTVYTRLRAEAEEKKQLAQPEKQESDNKRRFEEQKKERAAAAAEKRRLEQAQRRVAELEEELARIEADLAAPENAADYVKAAALCKRQEETEEELLGLYDLLMSAPASDGK